ncbi:hypothetical protein VaNZ11_011675 [Volvox africanus]|uniref:Senescence domain-containing protein n=1 Tax=Volvox africanus TaxID=51714 RepID=A0ABQ5SDE1_9CHLO|nr:hypothetical protein VaNZ11_011675 [Volvox africanus]
MAPGKGGMELAEALLQVRERTPGAKLHGDQPLRDPLATHGSADETLDKSPDNAPSSGISGAVQSASLGARDEPCSETRTSLLLPGGTSSAPEGVTSAPPSQGLGQKAADGGGGTPPESSGVVPLTGGGSASAASPPMPPASVSHLTAALREVASEPGATLRYPTPEGASDEKAFRGPPGVPLIPANAAADPATHNLIVAPGPSPGQVDVVEEVDLPPLAREDGSPVSEAAAVLEQVCERNPAIGPKPLHDPLAVMGNSDGGEGAEDGEDMDVQGQGEGETVRPHGMGAVDALTAAFAAVGLGRHSAEGEEVAAGGGCGSGEDIGRKAGGVIAIATEKLRNSAASFADVVRGSSSQVDQTARHLAAAVAASTAIAKDKAFGGAGDIAGSKAAALLGRPLVADAILGGGAGGRDQADVGEDWTAGPAP